MIGPGIAVSGLNVVLGGRVVLDAIDINARAGEITLLIGHNGSGKSTLLRALAGVVPFRALECSIGDDRNLGVDIALLQQDRNVFLYKRALENIAVGATHKFRPSSVEKRAVSSQVAQLFPQLKSVLLQNCSELSGGFRQLVALCRVLLSPAKIVLLDEPTVGLSGEVPEIVFDAILQRIRKNNSVAIVAEHNISSAARFVQKVYVLNEGRIRYSGSPDILTDRDRLRDVYL